MVAIVRLIAQPGVAPKGRTLCASAWSRQAKVPASDPRSIPASACLVAVLGLVVASCDGKTTPTAPTSTVSTPAPSPAPPSDCRALSCAFSGVIDGYSVHPYRLELTATGRIYLRLRSSAWPHTLMGTTFCRGLTCSHRFEDVGHTAAFAMADFELRAGDAVLVGISNLDPAPASFVLDFELDVGGAPPICVPTPNTPAPGAVLDNGRTDRRDHILWDFAWHECLGATDYDIEAARASSALPLFIANGVTGSSHRYATCDGYIADVNRLGWSWRVRAHAGARFGEWSAARPFDVERVNSDPIAAQCP